MFVQLIGLLIMAFISFVSFTKPGLPLADAQWLAVRIFMVGLTIFCAGTWFRRQ